MTLRDMIGKDPLLLDAPVLGTLPRTADGEIIGRGAELFSNDMCNGGPCPDGTSKLYVQDHSSLPEAHWYLGSWYSTREAAERAAGAGR